MKKLAVFVEGQTEQVFVEELLLNIAGRKNLIVDLVEARGGKKSRRKLIELSKGSPNASRAYFALICNCRTDNRVASDIADNYQGLVSQGYDAIIGLRDVYPHVTREEIPRLAKGLYYKIKTKPLRPLFVLAVMETEAWFLAEHTHFQRIDPRLTLTRISSEMGFDPSTDDVEQRDCPSQDLQDIYRLVGLGYSKSRDQVERTVEKLDYAILYVEVSKRIGWFGKLTAAIDAFLS